MVLTKTKFKLVEGARMMKQVVSKNGKVFCETEVPYPKEVIANMKKAGYKVDIKKDKGAKG